MAKYCFCHCFLYPRTECIMWYGVVRKFYLKTKWNQKGMKFRKSSLFDLYFRYLQLFLWEKLFSLTWRRRLPSITLHVTSFLFSVTLLTIVLNQWVSKNFCRYWEKKEMKVCNLFMIINKLPAVKRSIKMRWPTLDGNSTSLLLSENSHWFNFSIYL